MPAESITDKKKRAVIIIRLLQKHYPRARCTLNFDTVHQLLVATILSAQCTDERVNKVTPDLFKKYRTVKAFANADLKELERDIFTTGFYVNKARAIKLSAAQILNDFHGEIPRTLDGLVRLSGVGRKTGSVILGAGYGIAEGIVVDTHVGRISRLLGFTREKDAVKIEKNLIKIIPQNHWIKYSHELIEHGRSICKARKPACERCFLSKWCPSAGRNTG
ncbi:MAG: endonuclease III [Candidatus Zixiibacteriota bacterium]